MRLTETERAARIELAACYRLVALHGWDDLIYSRISLRVPDEPEHFLINPFGMMFEEVTASSLVKVDRDARPVEPTTAEINPEGFIPLIALHDARPDVHCVLHTHSPHGTAVACQRAGLLKLSQPSLFDVRYHAYEGYPLREAEKMRMREHLGSANAMVMHNHGLVTVGRSASEAFQTMYRLEAACRVQLLAQHGGGELLIVPQPVLDYIHGEARLNTARIAGPALAWQGLLRRLDRVTPGYRD